MCNPKLSSLCVGALMMILQVSFIRAGSADSNDYRLHVTGSVGRSVSVIQKSTSVDKAEYSRNGLDWSLRVMAQPDHLLGLGLESGHLHISTLVVKQDATLPEGSTMNLTAIPVLAMFSMEKYGVELSGGVGTYYYRAELSSGNVTTTSADWEIGWTGALAYRFELSHAWVLGVDATYHTIPERSVSLYSAGLRVEYQLWY